jgi:hypothetical protein
LSNSLRTQGIFRKIFSFYVHIGTYPKNLFSNFFKNEDAKYNLINSLLEL